MRGPGGRAPWVSQHTSVRCIADALIPCKIIEKIESGCLFVSAGGVRALAEGVANWGIVMDSREGSEEGAHDDRVAGTENEVRREDRPLRVFLSHKAEGDGKAHALNIKEQLEGAGAGNLRVYVSGHDDQGERYREVVKNKLRRSDWLVLLYTSPSQQWDWCLFESGFFEGGRSGQQKRLFVLHPEGVRRPNPLEEFTSVSVGAGTDEVEGQMISIRRFLDSMFRESLAGIRDRPVNVYISEAQLQALQQSFADALGLGEGPMYHTDSLSIFIKSVEAWRDAGRIPPDARAEGSLLAQFKFVKGTEARWNDVASYIATLGRESGRSEWAESWLRCMNQRMLSAHEAVTRVDPCLPALVRGRTGRHLRPVLRRVVKPTIDSAVFDFLFKPSASIDLRGSSAEGDLGRMSHLVGLGQMLRWGAVAPLIEELEEKATSDDLPGLYERFFDDIELNIKTELQASGYRRDRSMRALGSDENRGQLKDVITSWDIVLKSKLRDAMITHRDVAMSRRLALEMHSLTRRWLAICAGRFAELARDASAGESRPVGVVADRTAHKDNEGGAAAAAS